MRAALGGRREAVTIEGGDPAAAAAAVRGRGRAVAARRRPRRRVLRPADAGLVETVAAAGVPVQVGGGLRDPDAMQAALDAGAARIIVGTAALDDRSSRALRAFRRAARRRDRREGRPGRRRGLGRPRPSSPRASSPSAAPRPASRGCSSRARAATARSPGPTPSSSRRCSRSGVPVLAAGGIASLDDLRTLRDLGCEGAVVGSALWSGRFTLAEAIDAIRSDPVASPREALGSARRDRGDRGPCRHPHSAPTRPRSAAAGCPSSSGRTATRSFRASTFRRSRTHTSRSTSAGTRRYPEALYGGYVVGGKPVGLIPDGRHQPPPRLHRLRHGRRRQQPTSRAASPTSAQTGAASARSPASASFDLLERGPRHAGAHPAQRREGSCCAPTSRRQRLR